MKNSFLIILFALLSLTAKADTIDYWHVYYNGFLIKKCHEFGSCILILSKKDIQSTDSLSFKYCRDTPCFDCPSTIKIENEKGILQLEEKGIGTCRFIKFSAKEIAERAVNGELLLVYYIEELHPRFKNRLKPSKKFMLKIEVDD